MNAPATRRSPWLWWAVFFGVFFLLLACDELLYRYLHEYYNHSTRPVPWALRLPTRLLRSLEDWGENVFILAVLFAMWQLDSTRRSRVLCTILSAAVVTLSVEGMKRVVGRERPEVGQGKLLVRGPVSGHGRGDWHSFPSGHTASAGSYSGSIAAFYPPLRPVCIVLAAGCGASRVWKERHFASDCWFGGALGYWLALTLPSRRFMQPILARFDERFSKPAVSQSAVEITARFRNIRRMPGLISPVWQVSNQARSIRVCDEKAAPIE